jgi:outer membrane autotransporter protein
MSDTSRALARGRGSLLATSMLATSVLAGVGGLVGGVLLAPGVVVAQNILSGGTVMTTAPTAFQFGNAAGGSNAINVDSGGTLQVDSTLLIKDPSVTLTNAGVIDLLGAPAGSIQLNGPTTNFVGVAGGVIETTANLAAPGSPANTLNVATTSGVNGIVVDDGARTSAPSHVTTADPIVLVTATGTNGATFTLTGGTGFTTFGPNAAGLIKGPWLYTLDNNVPFGGTNDTVLVSQPGPAAFEAPVLVTAAQDIWYATAPWQDRQADLRDSSLLAPGSVGSFTPGVWVKAVGDWTDRTDSVDAGGGFVFNLGYHQDTYGLVGGVDAAGKWAAGVGLIGVGVGYLTSNVDFDSHMGNVSDGRFEGWTASVYATYIQDQFFIDGQVKGDFLQLHVNGLPGSNNWTSWGGQVESGYRFPLGGSVTLEPVGTLAYVSTDVGDANVAGTIFHYGTDDSFRGALGLRLSAPLMSNDSYMVKLAVDARVWDEFDGNNRVTLVSAGTPVELQDNFTGTFGEVGGAIDIYSHDGHSSGFITGSYKFKSDYDEGKVAIGYRYQWGAPPPPPPPLPPPPPPPSPPAT